MAATAIRMELRELTTPVLSGHPLAWVSDSAAALLLGSRAATEPGHGRTIPHPSQQRGARPTHRLRQRQARGGTTGR